MSDVLAQLDYEVQKRISKMVDWTDYAEQIEKNNSQLELLNRNSAMEYDASSFFKWIRDNRDEDTIEITGRIKESNIKMPDDCGEYDDAVDKMMLRFYQYKTSHPNDSYMYDNFIKQLKNDEQIDSLQSRLDLRIGEVTDYRMVSIKEKPISFWQKIIRFLKGNK